jgi:hypothetical protein
MTIGDAGVDALLIIRAVAGKRGDGTINPIEQRTDLLTVVNIVGGQRRRDDLASVGINPDMQFTPGLASAEFEARRLKGALYGRQIIRLRHASACVEIANS